MHRIDEIFRCAGGFAGAGSGYPERSARSSIVIVAAAVLPAFPLITGCELIRRT